MQDLKFIFLDRDGVINVEKELLHKKSDIELIPQSAEAIRLLNENDHKVIIITNQPVIARGLCTLEELAEIHKYMEALLAEKNARIDRIYFCPHHPTVGNNSFYTRKCECRKPKPGLIFQAQKEFNIKNLSECFMIGDKIADIKTGFLAGCKTILVETGYGGNEGFNDAVPDYKAKDLYDAVTNIILKNEALN